MKVDQQLIDDLVSGQLSGDRYRAALKAMDADPEKWRQCALAFLEEQALRQELTELAKGDALWANPRTLGHSSSEELSKGTLNQPLHVQSTGSDGVVQPSRWSGWGSGALSTAALLLVGVSMGWAVSEMATDGVGSDSSFVTNSNAPNPSFSNPLQPQFVDHFIELDHRIPAPLLELERKGKIRVESTDGFVPVTLDDGTPAFVPFQELKVLPNTQSF